MIRVRFFLLLVVWVAKRGPGMNMSKKGCQKTNVAAEKVLPSAKASQNKRWISEDTLNLVEQRRHAFVNGDAESYAFFNKEVKKSARTDRRRWLSEMAGSNDWNSLRKLRKQGAQQHQGRLKNSAGENVTSD